MSSKLPATAPPETRGGATVGRVTAAVACGLVAVGVALSAYAAHGADPAAVVRLERAALFLMLHGAGAAALLLARPPSWPRVVCGMMIVFGVVLFAGSLIASTLFGLSSMLAPAGGVLLISGWLFTAASSLFIERIDAR